ncbi:MAG: hypothetical protein ACYDDA_11995, partial [Acidiferrobacteraceae bacterium]
TGIDETLRSEDLWAIARTTPFLEWGALYSPARAGQPGRYPSRERLIRWLTDAPAEIAISLHLCGRAVPDLWHEEPMVMALVALVRSRGGRIQLNVNAHKRPEAHTWVMGLLSRYPDLTIITQHHQANTILSAGLPRAPNHRLLWDASGGRGQARDHWPPPVPQFITGYAGGLGPQNIAQELPRIAAAADGHPYWIDMEGALRVPSGSSDRMDLDKAVAVLRTVDLLQTPEERRKLYRRITTPRRQTIGTDATR